MPRIFAWVFLAASSTLLGCASTASDPRPTTAAPCPVCKACSAPSPTPSPTPSICPPPADPLDVATLVVAPESTPSDTPRGRLERTTWTGLDEFLGDDPRTALAAFLRGCDALTSDSASALTVRNWGVVCQRGQAFAGASGEDIHAYFRREFKPHRVVNMDDSDQGIVTGYYEPLLRGSRVRTETFKYPIYAPPKDLITVDLSALHPDLKFRRLRGRLVDNKLVPYFDRAEIEASPTLLRGLELAWVDNAVELFFMQIQGSGQLLFADGTRMRVGYADQNGHPFRSTAGALIRSGQIRAAQASMQGIKAWAAAHPRRVQAYLNMNPSYVFFKELSADLVGPIGTLGVPLTAERSIAVDQRVVPLGAPVMLATTFPGSKRPLNRLVVAQDTGGAIAGGVRVDYYWGTGDEAGELAGRMKQTGRMWVLLPKDYQFELTANAKAQK